jgi:glutathione synthase/RimK-type ligase-like ATP-grasp enzyme
VILVATCRQYPHPTPSLDCLFQALGALGLAAEHRPWTDTPVADFAAADLVLPLCCWDYHDKVERFAAWIVALEAAGARLVNAPAVLRWNLRKTYLLEMAARGLAVPATVHLRDADEAAVAGVLGRQGWPRAVLKPVSGQSGFGVRMLEAADPASWAIPKGEILLQDFQPEIATLGETTLTFIDGAFSHAVHRRLGPGEWRANMQYGATVAPVELAPEVIAAARHYLDAAPEIPAYARVDALLRPGGLLLMELEAIEPYLYFEMVEGSAGRLAQALLRRL